MRIIMLATLDELLKRKSQARRPVATWIVATEAATWRSLDDTRKTFPHADEVKTRRGSTVTVFNIGGNNYRLITAIHYRGGRVYIRELLTHAEYDKDDWKDRS